MRLNLGSGDQYIEDWVNVDYESPHRADQRVDLTGPLPWAPGSVSKVYAGHIFEHLTHDQCADLASRLLPCMTPDGELVAVGPDVDAALEMARGTNRVGKHSLEVIRCGGGRWPGDFHLWDTTAENVAEVLDGAGWEVANLGVSNLAVEWPVAHRDHLWQYAIYATPREEPECQSL